MEIDHAIDRLVKVTAKAGAPPPKPPTDTTVLDEIDATIAPLRLPPEVRRLWERIDPSTLHFQTYPAVTQPRFALDTWLTDRAEFGRMTPASLFLVGYESWQCMSVELVHENVALGGAMYEWALDDDEFGRRHETLADWLERFAGLVEAGRCELRTGERGPFLYIDAYEFPRAREPLINRAVVDWPLHWRRASGFAPENAVPRGPTHSIAELLESDPATPVEARVHAHLKSYSPGPPSFRGTIDDATGELTIVGSPSLLAYVTADGRYEFELEVPAGDRRAQASFDTRFRATATAIRPLEPREWQGAIKR